MSIIVNELNFKPTEVPAVRPSAIPDISETTQVAINALKIYQGAILKIAASAPSTEEGKRFKAIAENAISEVDEIAVAFLKREGFNA